MLTSDSQVAAAAAAAAGGRAGGGGGGRAVGTTSISSSWVDNPSINCAATSAAARGLVDRAMCCTHTATHTAPKAKG